MQLFVASLIQPFLDLVSGGRLVAHPRYLLSEQELQFPPTEEDWGFVHALNMAYLWDRMGWNALWLEMGWEGVEHALGAERSENAWDLLFYNRVGAWVGSRDPSGDIWALPREEVLSLVEDAMQKPLFQLGRAVLRVFLGR